MLRNHGGPAGFRGRFAPAGDEVAFGHAVAGELPLGGGRLFRLAAEPGRLLRVAVASQAFDVRLDIWTPDGGVHRFDDRARLDLAAQHTFLVGQRGAHHLLVYTSGGAGSGPFELEVDDLPIAELALDEPLTLDTAGGDAYAHLTCEAGRRLWLSVESACFDPALVVYDPDGVQVTSLEGGGIDWNVLSGFVAHKPGTYTLRVTSRQGSGDCVLRAIVP